MSHFFHSCYILCSISDPSSLYPEEIYPYDTLGICLLVQSVFEHDMLQGSDVIQVYLDGKILCTFYTVCN